MTHQRLLLVATDRLSAHRWRAGRIEVEAEFAGDTGGLEEFARYLKQQRHSTFHLLAVQAEDSFQIEALPRARGPDRNAMLARKLAQHGHGAALSLALSLGREKSGRRYERFLFAAVAGGQQIEPWLALLAAAKIRVAGLYTLPWLAAGIGTEAAGAAPLFQLLTLTGAGLHQIVFENGQPRLSRLTRVRSDSPEEVATAVAAESAKSYQYLLAQRTIDPGAALTTVVLLHPHDLANYRGHCADSDQIRYVFADLCGAAKEHGLRTLPQDSCSETLFLHLMIRKPPRAQYASAALRRGYQMWRLGLAATGAGAAILVGSALVAGTLTHEYLRLDEHIAALRVQSARDRQRFEAARRRLPPLPADIVRLRATVERYDRLARQAATLEPMLLRISRALDAVPGVRVERIDWRASDTEGRPGSVVAELVAWLPAELANEPRAQLDAIGRFGAALRLDRTVTVSSLALPVDIGSSHSLRGGGELEGGTDLSADAPQFSLRIVARR